MLNMSKKNLTVKELIYELKKYPLDMKIKVESDSYDFEEEFLLSNIREEDGKVVLYGN